MENYHLIAFDMDGTLLDKNKQITSRTHHAIRRALKCGKTVILSTGRGLDELKDYEDILKDIRYFICESGALIYDNFTNEILYSNQMSETIAKEILSITENRDVMFYYIANGKGYAEIEKAGHMAHYQLEIYQPMVQKNLHLVPHIREYMQQHLNCIEKFNIFSPTPEECADLIKKVAHLPVMLTNSEPTALEITNSGISKGSALKILCEKLNIPLEQTIAVGDSNNDIEIMKTAGLSIGMGNSAQEVKEICKVIVSDNNHNGCVEAIEKYLIA